MAEEVDNLKSALDKLSQLTGVTWLDGYYLKVDGTTSTATGFITSDFIVIPEDKNIYYDVRLAASHILIYDANKKITDVIDAGGEATQCGYISRSINSVYVRLST